MAVRGPASFLVILAFVSAASAYTSRISLCLCTETEECGFLEGVLHRGSFVFVDNDNNEYRLPIVKIKTYPHSKCAGQPSKRFLISLDKGLDVDLGVAHVGVGKDGVSAGVAGNEVAVGPDGVSGKANVDLGPLGHVKGGVSVGPDGAGGNVDAAVHAGVVDGNAKVDVDKDGQVSGGVGGKVNVDGVEVGGNVAVDKNGQVSGGASLGVGLGPLGGIDVHVTAGPDGVKTGVGAHVDAGTVHAGVSVDVDQNGKVGAAAGGNVDLGPLGQLSGAVGVDGSGHVSGGASGSLGVGPASVSGNVNVDGGQISGGVSGNVNAGQINAGGSLNIGSNGQMTGSGSVDVGGMTLGSGIFSSGGSSSGGMSSMSGGASSSSASGTTSGGSSSSGGGIVSSGTSSSGGAGSVGTDFTGVSGWKPNMFNPSAMMSGLPSGGQSGTGYNPATFFQQAGYKDFLAKMVYGR